MADPPSAQPCAAPLLQIVLSRLFLGPLAARRRAFTYRGFFPRAASTTAI